MRWTRVVSRCPSKVRATRPPRVRRRAEIGSSGSSVNRLRGRRARSSTRPASRGATNRAVWWWSATAALARRYRCSTSPGIRAPGSAMQSAIARQNSSPGWLACRRTVRRTSRAASRVGPGRLRRVVVGDGPADRAGARSRPGRRAHRRGTAAELDPRVRPTHLLPPGHCSGDASAPSSAFVPVPPSAARRGPGAPAVVASDDRVNVSEKEREESREGEGVSGRAPLVRPALCQGADERLAACRQRPSACRGTSNPLSSVRVFVLRGISRRDRPRSCGPPVRRRARSLRSIRLRGAGYRTSSSFTFVYPELSTTLDQRVMKPSRTISGARIPRLASGTRFVLRGSG